MESEQEWQFITNEIQNKSGSRYDEWSIGLKKNSVTRRWTWINGKSLTIDKWHKEGINPDPNDTYGLIHKEYPPGFKDHLVPIGATLEDNGFARKKQVLISSTKRAIVCESKAVVIHSFFPTSYPHTPPPPPTPLLVLYPNVHHHQGSRP